jgi:hypothetical protein
MFVTLVIPSQARNLALKAKDLQDPFVAAMKLDREQIVGPSVG